MTTTATRSHRMVEFRMTPVAVERIDGRACAVPDPAVIPVITYGCDECNAGLDEALANPHCPGAQEDP